jgi:hypothetical protein
VLAGEAMMARHPEVKQAILDWFIKTVNFQYGPLYEELKFTPAQIERFGELVRSDGLFGEYGANGAFLEFPLPQDVPRGHVLDALREFLGPEGWRKFHDYSGMVWARQTVAQLASRAWLLEVPLTPEQAAKLVAGMAPIPWSEGGKADARYWDRILRGVAQPTLDAEQLAILESIAAAEMRSSEMMELWKSEAPKAAASR